MEPRLIITLTNPPEELNSKKGLLVTVTSENTTMPDFQFEADNFKDGCKKAAKKIQKFTDEEHDPLT